MFIKKNNNDKKKNAPSVCTLLDKGNINDLDWWWKLLQWLLTEMFLLGMHWFCIILAFCYNDTDTEINSLVNIK